MAPHNSILQILFWINLLCVCWTHAPCFLVGTDVSESVALPCCTTPQRRGKVTSIVRVVAEISRLHLFDYACTKTCGQNFKCSAVTTYLYLCKVQYNQRYTVYSEFCVNVF
jgi:hypothetical protein